MKRKILAAIAAVALLVAGFTAGTVYGAQSAEPGSEGDPIITLSYLNSRLDEMGGVSTAENASVSTGFKKVTLTKGQSLTLDDGGEMVVYSGNGTVIGTTGLLSLSGSELFGPGTNVVLYNHYMGLGAYSGVKATGNMTVYIKGEYSIR